MVDEFGLGHANLGAKITQSWSLPREWSQGSDRALEVPGIGEAQLLIAAEKKDLIVPSALLCDAANVFNADHTTDARIFVHPARTGGHSQDKSSYSQRDVPARRT